MWHFTAYGSARTSYNGAEYTIIAHEKAQIQTSGFSPNYAMERPVTITFIREDICIYGKKCRSMPSLSEHMGKSPFHSTHELSWLYLSLGLSWAHDPWPFHPNQKLSCFCPLCSVEHKVSSPFHHNHKLHVGQSHTNHTMSQVSTQSMDHFFKIKLFNNWRNVIVQLTHGPCTISSQL